MAPQTSKTNSSGKAKSPRVSSNAMANSSGFFLSRPTSTIVAAGERRAEWCRIINFESEDMILLYLNHDKMQRQIIFWAHRRVITYISTAQVVTCSWMFILTKFSVSDAHVALQEVVHFLYCLLLKFCWLETTNNSFSSSVLLYFVTNLHLDMWIRWECRDEYVSSFEVFFCLLFVCNRENLVDYIRSKKETTTSSSTVAGPLERSLRVPLPVPILFSLTDLEPFDLDSSISVN